MANFLDRGEPNIDPNRLESLSWSPKRLPLIFGKAPNWGFPKLGVPFGAPIIRIMAHWGLYGEFPLILGNYLNPTTLNQVEITSQLFMVAVKRSGRPDPSGEGFRVLGSM